MFKKLTFILIGLLATVSTVSAAETLYEWYSDRGESLPSVSERPYEEAGITNASGTAEENLELLDYLDDDSPFNLGVAQRPSSYKTTLAESLAATASTTEDITVSSITTKDSHVLVDADVGDFIILTISPGRGNEEKVLCTEGTNSSDTWENCTRGYSYYTQGTGGTVYSHGPGETVIISDDDAYISTQLALFDSVAVWPQSQTWTASTSFELPPFSYLNPTTTFQLANKAYVDGVGAGGFTAANIGDGLTIRANNTSPETMDINTSTEPWWFTIDTDGFFALSTTTDKGIDTFWKDSWNTTTTKPLDFTFSDNLTIGETATSTTMDATQYCVSGANCITQLGPVVESGTQLIIYPDLITPFAATHVLSANVVYTYPITIPNRMTVTKIGGEVTSGSGAGNEVAFGIYSADGNTKYVDSGAKDTAGGNIFYSTTLGTSVTLEAGPYLMAWTNDGTLTIRGVAAGANHQSFLNFGADFYGTAANASANGVFPATLGSITSASNNVANIVISTE